MTKYNQKIILKEKIKKIKIKIELKIEIIKKLNQNLNLINKENLKEY